MAAVNGKRASLEVLYEDKDQATLVFGPLGVVIWRGETTLQGVARVKEVGLAALGNSPGAAAVTGIVEETASIPNAEARQLSAEVNDFLSDQGVRAFGAIFPDDGFGGAWKRGVITGLNLLARRRYPLRVFKHPLEACRWFAELQSVPDPDWALAASALDRYRHEYSARFGRTLSKAS